MTKVVAEVLCLLGVAGLYWLAVSRWEDGSVFWAAFDFSMATVLLLRIAGVRSR